MAFIFVMLQHSSVVFLTLTFIIGKSKPINRQLTKIAMNIDITDQTGKGNKDIVEIYGKDVFEIMEHTLTVKIPYNKLATPLGSILSFLVFLPLFIFISSIYFLLSVI